MRGRGSVSPRRAAGRAASRRGCAAAESTPGSESVRGGSAPESESARSSESEGAGRHGTSRRSVSPGRSESARASESAGRPPSAAGFSGPSIRARMFLSSRLAVPPERIERRRLIVRCSLSASSRTMLSRRIVCSESTLPSKRRSESMHPRTARSSRR